jgi:hypothetical protein
MHRSFPDITPNHVLVIFDAGTQMSIQPLESLTTASPFFATQLALPIQVRPLPHPANHPN